MPDLEVTVYTNVVRVQYYIMYCDSDFDELNAYDNTERERNLVEEVSAAAAVLAVCIIEARKR
jgi:hypothetical protein